MQGTASTSQGAFSTSCRPASSIPRRSNQCGSRGPIGAATNAIRNCRASMIPAGSIRNSLPHICFGSTKWQSAITASWARKWICSTFSPRRSDPASGIPRVISSGANWNAICAARGAATIFSVQLPIPEPPNPVPWPLVPKTGGFLRGRRLAYNMAPSTASTDVT